MVLPSGAQPRPGAGQSTARSPFIIANRGRARVQMSVPLSTTNSNAGCAATGPSGARDSRRRRTVGATAAAALSPALEKIFKPSRANHYGGFTTHQPSRAERGEFEVDIVI
ncbi:hypothetical protein AOQ84DRAFT_225156 [Glonium stellatum]|uniref:Uncharacterized protein n=1 Tax=Glonium stellatum TaxID=574774 RepID=A0A8E2EUL6_9PEZI|nr:hypothetical protein AOQ84DRAFT_225156 [Glonium stellatum]